MKDRQFMMMLALAIAAGLVIGLFAFRSTGGTPASGGVAATTANGAAPTNSSLPPPSDEQVAEQPVEFNPPATAADAQDGGPSAPVKDPPPMQAQLVGDSPPPSDGTQQ